MKIAAVINDEGEIKKLPDGKWIVIYDTYKKEMEKHDNPGFYAHEKRRLQTTLKMIELKVEVVLVPSQGFCKVSYSRAKGNMRFILVKEGEKFDDMIRKLPELLANVLVELPEDALFITS
ncbi:MAG: hypothetical protein ACP5GU_09195 [Thermoprotei archaeon]|jgi:hypothetical protein